MRQYCSEGILSYSLSFMNVVILENIRSAYNVGNIIRTADALWRDVWLTWYTPSPYENKKVLKTSLWAENNVNIKQFGHTPEAITYAKQQGMTVIAAEITKDSLALQDFVTLYPPNHIAIVFGNEIDGILDTTLKLVDHIVHIPMQGIKESLNVWQSSAIFMRALKQTK